jgi:hypothetical protein
VIKNIMSTGMKATDKIISIEKRERLEEYEPLVDWLLRDGQRLGLGSSEYQEKTVAGKFDSLAEFYNENLDETEEYSFDDIIEYVKSIENEPEPQKPKTGQEPEIKTELVQSTKTGNPRETDLRKVVMILETPESKDDQIKYTGLVEY